MRLNVKLFGEAKTPIELEKGAKLVDRTELLVAFALKVKAVEDARAQPVNPTKAPAKKPFVEPLQT